MGTEQTYTYEFESHWVPIHTALYYIKAKSFENYSIRCPIHTAKSLLNYNLFVCLFVKVYGISTFNTKSIFKQINTSTSNNSV